MGWSREAIAATKRSLGCGGPVKCCDNRYGKDLGVADVDLRNKSVTIFEHKQGGEFWEDNGVVICTFSSVDEMIDSGWVID